jgi:streptogramin lyase
MRCAAGLLLIALGAAGCAQECVDEDGDGFGPHCERGPDCDDEEATLATRCPSAPDCDDDPFAPGCTCFLGEHRACYPGPPETLDVASCRGGEQTCASTVWTACEGAVVPGAEACNGDDDDCDGKTDEGVRSPCGGCDARCSGGVWGEGYALFTEGDGVGPNPRGELVLGRRPIETGTLFLPNTGEGTVSAIDADQALELGRYRTAGEGPISVAIDYRGDAFVLDPSAEGRAVLTRIAAERSRCVDRASDGLSTSSGGEDVLALGSDDCVIASFMVGAPGEGARALAIGGQRAPDANDGALVWVGLEAAEAFSVLHGETGEELFRLETPGFRPRAAALDPWGTVWAIDRNGLIASIAPGPGAAVHVIEAPLACFVLEALAIDAEGVLTLTGAECERVTRYDPRLDRFEQVAMRGVLDARAAVTLPVAPESTAQDAGMDAGEEAGESLLPATSESWVTHTAGSLSRIAHAPLALRATYSLAGDSLAPFDATAIGRDAQGRLWIASSVGGPDDNGVLTRFDPVEGAVTAQVPLGFLPRPEGDFTGARRFARSEPEGSARYVFEGCNPGARSGDPNKGASPTVWKALHVGAAIEAGSSVEIEARHALERDALEDATFERIVRLPEDEQPQSLAFPEGGFVEVKLTLRTADYLGGPRVQRVGIEWQCTGPQ